MTKKIRPTEEQWRWIWDRWLEGYTLRELAEFLGLARETVRRRFQRMGLRTYAKEELQNLEERRDEFNQLR